MLPLVRGDEVPFAGGPLDDGLVVFVVTFVVSASIVVVSVAVSLQDKMEREITARARVFFMIILLSFKSSKESFYY